MVSLNSMMNRVAEKHFLKVTKRRKLTDSRTHSPSETFTTLDLSPGTYDRVGRAFVSPAFASLPSSLPLFLLGHLLVLGALGMLFLGKVKGESRAAEGP